MNSLKKPLYDTFVHARFPDVASGHFDYKLVLVDLYSFVQARSLLALCIQIEVECGVWGQLDWCQKIMLPHQRQGYLEYPDLW